MIYHTVTKYEYTLDVVLGILFVVAVRDDSDL